MVRKATMTLGRALQTAFIAVAAFAVYSFVAAAKDGENRRVCASLCHLKPAYAARNRTAPDFELASLDGGKIRLSDYRGKTVVLNFWTKNCRPCLEEMPSLAQLASSLRGRSDVVVLAVSTDETVEDARSTLRSVLGTDAPFATVVDPESAVVAGKFGTKLYPETWIVDGKGIIRARFDGGRDWMSPLVHDLIDQLRHPLPCAVHIESGGPVPASPMTCDDVAG
jgi:peroxiredoxin